MMCLQIPWVAEWPKIACFGKLGLFDFLGTAMSLLIYSLFMIALGLWLFLENSFINEFSANYTKL